MSKGYFTNEIAFESCQSQYFTALIRALELGLGALTALSFFGENCPQFHDKLDFWCDLENHRLLGHSTQLVSLQSKK